MREQLRTDDQTKTTKKYGENMNRTELLVIFRGRKKKTHVVRNSSCRWRCSSNFYDKSKGTDKRSLNVNDVAFALMVNYSERWAHRGRPAVVAVLSAVHVDLGVAVGGVEPARLLPLLPLLQELQGQPRGSAVHVLREHERRDRGGDFHIALVSWLISHNGLPVGVACPVTLQQRTQRRVDPRRFCPL